MYMCDDDKYECCGVMQKVVVSGAGMYTFIQSIQLDIEGSTND